MPHTVLLCLPLVFIRYMSVCAAHRKLHFSSSPLLTAAYAYTVSACLAATAPLVRRSPTPSVSRPAAHPSQGSSVPPADYPAARLVRLHPPSLAPPPLIYRFSRAHRAYIVRTRRTHPAKALKLQAFGFFAKHFKLCSQLAERT